MQTHLDAEWMHACCVALLSHLFALATMHTTAWLITICLACYLTLYLYLPVESCCLLSTSLQTICLHLLKPFFNLTT